MTTVNNPSYKTETQPDSTPEQVTQKIPNRRPIKQKQSVQKSAGAFRTISEVAEELNVEQHVLRFWETKFSQIKPLKRGGGRRYYRPEDVELLKTIYNLLYQEGYTIKGVQKLLSNTRGGAAKAEGGVAKAVQKNRAELQTMLDELKSMRKLIG